jgi:uncharacterized protein (DUF1684 family)
MNLVAEQSMFHGLRFVRLLLLLGVVCPSSSLVFGQTTQAALGPAFRKDFEKWKSSLVQSRKQEWLTLAGLFWLKPGENTFGADSANQLVFPAGKIAAKAGVFELQDGQVTMKLASGVTALIDGRPVASSVHLEPDIAEKTTVVSMGSLQFHVIVRGQRVGIRLQDLQNPAVTKYQGPVFYPLDASWRVVARWVPSDGKKTEDVPNVLGDVTPTPVAGTAVFTLRGQKMQLEDLGGDPAESLFFVFSDPTSKSDTYPGGRFLYAGPVVNGTVILDFNRAYNPPCSVTPYATCPLAPKVNRLSVPIAAGEKYDRKRVHPTHSSPTAGLLNLR